MPELKTRIRRRAAGRPVFVKKMLVPVDLSEASAVAWRHATAWARVFGADVEAVYAQQWLHSALGLGVGDPFVTADAAERALAALRARFPEADLRALTGDPEEVIPSFAARQGYQLIVMGTHARTGLDRILSGSIAESVVRRSSVPVLIAKGPPREIRSVLVPYKPAWYGWESLEAGARLAAAFGARLSVLHVLSAPLYKDAEGFAGMRRMLSDVLSRLPSELRRTTRPAVDLAFGDPAREIVSAAGRHGLVVITARRKGFLADEVLGTTAERVIRHSPRPVLAVPAVASKPARAR